MFSKLIVTAVLWAGLVVCTGAAFSELPPALSVILFVVLLSATNIATLSIWD